MPRSRYLFYGTCFGIVLLVLLGSLLSVHNNRKTTDLTPNMHKRLQNLLQTACAEALKAQQDTNPLISLMHNYNAKAYIDACQFLSGNNLAGMSNVLGVNVEEDIKDKIAKSLQLSVRKITSQCPKLSVKGAEHLAIGAGWVA